MKNLTHQEFLDSPPKVQFLQIAAITKQPIGSKIVNDAISEHPEYFPDELEHRRKWALIPQQVHDDYWKEREALLESCYKDLPPSRGILGWINDPKGYEEWETAYAKCQKIEQPLVAALHKKFYGQYGIEWNGW